MSFLKPRLSEKSFALSQTTNTFAIDVTSDMNAAQVAAAIETQFDVQVARVRVLNRKGKTKRTINITGKRSSNRRGTQSDLKKAYVTLATGSHLPFFEAEEKEAAAAAKEATAKKTTKPAEEKPKVKGLKKLVGKKESK